MPEVRIELIDPKITQAAANDMMAPLELDLNAYYKLLQEDVLKAVDMKTDSPEDIINTILDFFNPGPGILVTKSEVMKELKVNLNRLYKAGKPVGTISTHADGTKWKKVSEGKWVQIPEDKEKIDTNQLSEGKNKKLNIFRGKEYYDFTDRDYKEVESLIGNEIDIREPDSKDVDKIADGIYEAKYAVSYGEFKVDNGNLLAGYMSRDKIYNYLQKVEYPYFFRYTDNKDEETLGNFQSVNTNTGEKEKGISVSPHPMYDPLKGDYKYLFSIEGEVVGYGSDGEPLLKNPKYSKPLNRKKTQKNHVKVQKMNAIKRLKEMGIKDRTKIINILKEYRIIGETEETEKSLSKSEVMKEIKVNLKKLNRKE